MISAFLVVLGAVLAIGGVTVSVGAAAVNRVELYRWVTGRLRGADAAETLLATPARITRGAAATTSAGVLVAAFGIWVTVASLPLPLLVLAVGLIAVPVFAGAVFALGRAAGRHWPEELVRGGIPWIVWAARLLVPVRSTAEASRERLEPTRSDVVKTLGTEQLSAVSEVLTFAERPVREIMTPRPNVVAVREGASLEEIGAAFAESGYSRIPVYRETLDNITSMVYAIDLFKVPPGGELPLRPVATAPASKPCGDLLFQMQRDRQQLAVVLDEYGGTAGIVTFDDLVQALVDAISPSTNGAREEPRTMDVIEVSGTTPLAEIAARFEASILNEAETIGGVLARAAGRIPARGERFELGGLEFDILDASATRVKRVAVRRGTVPVVKLDRTIEP